MSLTWCSRWIWLERSLQRQRQSGPKPKEWSLLPSSALGSPWCLSRHCLSNPTVAPNAHIIHFFRSASFTMATSRHLYARCFQGPVWKAFCPLRGALIPLAKKRQTVSCKLILRTVLILPRLPDFLRHWLEIIFCPIKTLFGQWSTAKMPFSIIPKLK